MPATRNNLTQLLVVVILALVVVALTVLIALDKNIEGLVAFLASAIIPTVAGLGAMRSAEKARETAEGAKTSADRAVHNTNGRMTELIQILQTNGLPVPEGYEDVTGGTESATTEDHTPRH